MFLRDEEIELWRHEAGLGMEGSHEGEYVLTNQRMMFEIQKKMLFGLISGSKDIIWEVDHENIKDIKVVKKSLLGMRKLTIISKDKEVRLYVKGMGPEKAKTQINNFIHDSRNMSKEELFNKQKEVAKAGSSTVNVNVGNSTNIDPSKPLTGTSCFACGAPIDDEEIEWIAPGKFRCPFCGGTNKKQS